MSANPGYYMNPEDRAVVLRDYREALEKRTFINLSENGMKETLQFIVKAGGEVEHSAAENTQDPSGQKGAHGDEVIADALVSRMRSVKGKISEKPEMKDPPWMSPAWRLKKYEEEMALASVDADW